MFILLWHILCASIFASKVVLTHLHLSTAWSLFRILLWHSHTAILLHQRFNIDYELKIEHAWVEHLQKAIVFFFNYMYDELRHTAWSHCSDPSVANYSGLKHTLLCCPFDYSWQNECWDHKQIKNVFKRLKRTKVFHEWLHSVTLKPVKPTFIFICSVWVHPVLLESLVYTDNFPQSSLVHPSVEIQTQPIAAQGNGWIPNCRINVRCLVLTWLQPDGELIIGFIRKTDFCSHILMELLMTIEL